MPAPGVPLLIAASNSDRLQAVQAVALIVGFGVSISQGL